MYLNFIQNLFLFSIFNIKAAENESTFKKVKNINNSCDSDKTSVFFEDIYINEEKNMFYTNGFINLDEINSLITIKKYMKPIINFRINEDEIDNIYESSDINPIFGEGLYCCSDCTYKRCLEINWNYIEYKYNPKLNSDLNASISKLLNEKKFDLSLDRMEIYNEGDEFKIHKNSMRTKSQVATLILIFPTLKEGGIFSLYHNKTIVEFDFSKLNNEIGYVCFFNGIDNKISRVKKGSFVLMRYYVCVNKLPEIDSLMEICKTYSVLYNKITEFVKSLKNQDFKEKKYLGIFTFQIYYKDVASIDHKYLIMHLNGIDIFFYLILKENNYDPVMCLYYDTKINAEESFKKDNGGLFDDYAGMNPDIYDIYHEVLLEKMTYNFKYRKEDDCEHFYVIDESSIDYITILNKENTKKGFDFIENNYFSDEGVATERALYAKIIMLWRIDGEKYKNNE